MVSAFLVGWVILLSCAFTRGLHAAPVRIAYSSLSGAMLPLWVAKDKKFFEKHGVDVDLTYIRGVAIALCLPARSSSSAHPRLP